MTHTRCPTHAGNITAPTSSSLASAPQCHNKSRAVSSSISPTTRSWSFPSLRMDLQLESNDFQSNAQVDTRQAANSTQSLAGLGIRFAPTRTSPCNIEDIHDADPQSISRQFDSRNQPSRTFRDLFNEQKHPSMADLSAPQMDKSQITTSMTPIHEPTLASLDLVDGILLDDLTLEYPPLDMQAPWSFDVLSAASGFSTDALAAHISASAERTLQQMSSDSMSSWSLSSLSGSSLSGDIFMNEFAADTDRHTQPRAWPVLPNYNHSPEITTPLADPNISVRTENCRDLAGVNPAEIMGDPHDEPDSLDSYLLSSSSAASSLSSLHSSTCVTSGSRSVDEEITSTVPRIDDNVIKSHIVSENSGSDVSCRNQEPECTDDREKTSDYEPTPRLDSSSDDSDSSTFPSPPARRKALVSKDERRLLAKKSAKKNALPTENFINAISRVNEPAIDLGSPVFDAHRGISLFDLKAKAERYKLRNPGQDFDKRWLISFAGKLSARGELVDEFRCYVIGCHQKNKRRDHILIHLGAHLDQRPFKCSQCPSRFLRKNECKRHELSHSGKRPFSCGLCTSATTAFVRQDLLKRHLKRTHHVDTTDKENIDIDGERPRKRAKRST